MVDILCTEKPYRNPFVTPNKLLEQIQGKGYYGFISNENWTPNVNLYETDSAYCVCVDLAGVDKDKIEVDVVDGRLRLRGNRAVPICVTECPGARMRMHLMEIDHGSFARDVELPDNVHQDQISAKYVDGMLWIELPKKN
jgi:HSP20 family protein